MVKYSTLVQQNSEKEKKQTVLLQTSTRDQGISEFWANERILCVYVQFFCVTTGYSGYMIQFKFSLYSFFLPVLWGCKPIVYSYSCSECGGWRLKYGSHLFVNHKLEKTVAAYTNYLSHLPTTTVHTRTLYYPSAGFHCEKIWTHTQFIWLQK